MNPTAVAPRRLVLAHCRLNAALPGLAWRSG